jgi:hypothetical protein
MLWRVLSRVLGVGLGAMTRSKSSGSSVVDEADAGVWLDRLA